MGSKPLIIFILSSISQPRCHKRINGFIEAGYPVKIFGFDRGVYNINAKIANHPINILGYAEQGGNYIKRLFISIKLLKKIFKEHNNNYAIYYVFGFDIALICRFLSKKPYIYEISDLIYTYFNNRLLEYLIKNLDKFLIKSSLLTIVITRGFIDYLFPGKCEWPNNIIVQPNKVNFALKNINIVIRHSTTNKQGISFGFAGLIRYENTILRFAQVIGERFPEHSFFFFGDSTNIDKVKKLADKYENVFYKGVFKNPEDLPSVYSNIDIVVATYRTDTVNERVAEPNKFYEALFFSKPVIVSKGTYLEQLTLNKYECGFAIDATNDKNIIQLISNIDNEQLIKISSNIEKYPKSEFLDDNSKKIISFIDNIVYSTNRMK